MASPLITIEEINKRLPKNSLLKAVEYIKRHVSKGGVTRSKVRCLCSCGKTKDCIVADLLRGNPLSCGCRKRANLGNPQLYKRWWDMRNRCYNKDHKQYNAYGGRGVRICDEWLNDFEAFNNWALNNGYNKDLQLDKDVLGDGLLYSPTTCKWATQLENMSTTRNSVKYEYKGVMLSIPEISRLTGIPQGSLKYRIKAGKSIVEAVEQKKEHKYKIYKNE